MLECTFDKYLPKELFYFSLKEETYDEEERQLIRAPRKGGSPLVPALVKCDCAKLRDVRGIKASEAKSFYFNEYGLANRGILEILDLPSMKEAINKTTCDRGVSPDWGRFWDTEADNWVMTHENSGLATSGAPTPGAADLREDTIRRGTKRGRGRGPELEQDGIRKRSAKQAIRQGELD